MAKGIIYLMTSIVPGLIKIGKTTTKNFESRMYSLEHNGYCNITGLKRAFAIEVEDYDDKEMLLHTIFGKSIVADTELFALDINRAIQLLAAFEGDVIYPPQADKEEIFDKATSSVSAQLIPDGTYFFERKKKTENNKTLSATVKIKEGNWLLLKGSVIAVSTGSKKNQKCQDLRESISIDSDGKLLEDVSLGICTPSFAGQFVLNQTACNGWKEWKTKSGKPIDIFRKNEE